MRIAENSHSAGAFLARLEVVEMTTLYRPVGQKDLDLIEAAGWRAFPPRLSWQPIFYPVLHEEYAIEIARDWNTKDEQSGFGVM